MSVSSTVIDFRFIKPPRQGTDGNWAWPHLQIRPVPGLPGVRGVYATEDIGPGLLIPYVGRIARTSNYRASADRDTTHAMGWKGYTYSGNPEKNSECSHNYCVASMINEATAGDPQQKYNCTFCEVPKQCVPAGLSYLHWGGDGGPAVLVLSPIPRDQQLFVWYGTEYVRHGYTARRGTHTRLADSNHASPGIWNLAWRQWSAWGDRTIPAEEESTHVRFDSLRPGSTLFVLYTLTDRTLMSFEGVVVKLSLSEATVAFPGSEETLVASRQDIESSVAKNGAATFSTRANGGERY
jgi:hypothetical protein